MISEYDNDIALALARNLEPIIMQSANGALTPVLKGIPSFLAEVHEIIEKYVKDLHDQTA